MLERKIATQILGKFDFKGFLRFKCAVQDWLLQCRLFPTPPFPLGLSIEVLLKSFLLAIYTALLTTSKEDRRWSNGLKLTIMQFSEFHVSYLSPS